MKRSRSGEVNGCLLRPGYKKMECHLGNERKSVKGALCDAKGRADEMRES